MNYLIQWWRNRHERRKESIRKRAEEYARDAFNIEFIDNLFYVTYNGVVISLPKDTEHTLRLQRLREMYVENELKRCGYGE